MNVKILMLNKFDQKISYIEIMVYTNQIDV